MKRLGFALAITLASCGDTTGPDSQLRSLMQHEDLWRSANIKNYDFVLTEGGAWIPPIIVLVSVRGGVVTSGVIQNVPPGATPLAQYNWPTLDSLFVYARRELTIESPESHRDYLTLAFDPRYAFVTTLNADNPKWADDEYWVTVSSFVRR